jgi:hypothetical protein
VNGLRTRVAGARSLAGEPIALGQFGSSLRLLGPRTEPTPYDSVIEIELEGPPEFQPGLAEEVNGGGWRLDALSARLTGGLKAVPAALREGTPARLEGWTNATDAARWTLPMPEIGAKQLRICYACPLGSAGQEFAVRVGDRVWHSKTIGTHADGREYRTFLLGEVNFPEAGDYEVIVTAPGQPKDGLFRLAWLFVQ